MYYIFQVHNFISLSVAKKYILIHKLKKSKCILIYWRAIENYKLKDDELKWVRYYYAAENIDFRFYTDFHIFDYKTYLRNKKAIIKFNLWIQRLTNKESFIYFTPHLAYVRDRVFVKNKKCKGFYYLEEGLMSYHVKINENQLKIRSIKNFIINILIFNKHIYLGESIFPELRKLKGHIGLNKHSFSGFKKRILIGLPFDKVDVANKFETIIVLENYKLEMFSEKIYFKLIDYILSQPVIEKSNIIHYKPHPMITEYPEEEKKIHSYFKKKSVAFKKSINPLPKNIALETIAFNFGPKVNFIGVSSAALLYAYFCNAKIYFLTHLLAERDKNFRKFINHKSDKYPGLIPNFFLNIAFKNKIN